MKVIVVYMNVTTLFITCIRCYIFNIDELNVIVYFVFFIKTLEQVVTHREIKPHLILPLKTHTAQPRFT